MRKLLFLLIILLPASALAQAEKKPAVWEPMKLFVGEWEGEGKRQPGNSKVERNYQFTLNNHYLQVKNTSVSMFWKGSQMRARPGFLFPRPSKIFPAVFVLAKLTRSLAPDLL